MKRRSSLEVFGATFPSVNIQTKIGMAMFQGFVGGFNKAVESRNGRRAQYKKEMEALSAQVKELEDFITQMRQISIHPNDLKGDE